MNLLSLHTDRLILRPVEATDVQTLFALRSNPDLMRYIPRPIATKLADAEAIIQIMLKGIEDGTKRNWAVTLKENNTCIGIFGYHQIYPEHFRAELGYMVLPEFQRKGYTTEAVRAIVNYGFTEMNLHSIEAIIDPRNIASEKVLTNLGFQKEAHFHENMYFEGCFIDSAHYTLFR
jgi:[ribosomal protein S5]-alanine N-acetyltransferase